MENSATGIAIFLVVALMCLAGWYYNHKKRQQKNPGKPDVTSITRSLIVSKAGADRTSALIRACAGDRKQAERLIRHEKHKASGISHAEAVSRALQQDEICGFALMGDCVKEKSAMLKTLTPWRA
jgi:hypothetical protein